MIGYGPNVLGPTNIFVIGCGPNVLGPYERFVIGCGPNVLRPCVYVTRAQPTPAPNVGGLGLITNHTM